MKNFKTLEILLLSLFIKKMIKDYVYILCLHKIHFSEGFCTNLRH